MEVTERVARAWKAAQQILGIEEKTDVSGWIRQIKDPVDVGRVTRIQFVFWLGDNPSIPRIVTVDMVITLAGWLPLVGTITHPLIDIGTNVYDFDQHGSPSRR